MTNPHNFLTFVILVAGLGLILLGWSLAEMGDTYSEPFDLPKFPTVTGAVTIERGDRKYELRNGEWRCVRGCGA